MNSWKLCNHFIHLWAFCIRNLFGYLTCNIVAPSCIELHMFLINIRFHIWWGVLNATIANGHCISKIQFKPSCKTFYFLKVFRQQGWRGMMNMHGIEKIPIVVFKVPQIFYFVKNHDWNDLSFFCLIFWSLKVATRFHHMLQFNETFFDMQLAPKRDFQFKKIYKCYQLQISNWYQLAWIPNIFWKVNLFRSMLNEILLWFTP
jgi:hypothetical protein